MSRAARRSVLIVEDAPGDARLLQLVLQEVDADIHTEHVSGGREALELLERAHSRDELPGMIFLDLHLPRMEGTEVLARLKSHPSLRKVPVVVLTGGASPADLDACKKFHANAVIEKPESVVDYRTLVGNLTQIYLDAHLDHFEEE